ncbi:MAG: outer membrane beta-barrel protein [Ignavibacteria bacterium]
MIAIFAFSNVSNAQKIKKTTKLKQTYFTISPTAGLIFPVGNFANLFKSGYSLGLDLGYRVNKEVGFYGKFGYSGMNSKTDGIASGRYLEFSAGPRYYMTNPKLSSTLFLEGGVGAYMFGQDAYTNAAGETVLKLSDTKVGVNAGIGANLALSNSIDILLKTKYHNVFADGGSHSFITAIGGFEFKIR